MHVILDREPLEEIDYFKYLGSQVAADGGCETDLVNRMNEGYRAWGTLKSVLSNRGLLLLLLLKKVSSARLGESDIHPISPKTPAPQYQPIDRKKRKGKKVED